MDLAVTPLNNVAQQYLDHLERLGRFLKQLPLPEMAAEELVYAQALVRNYIARHLERRHSDNWHLAVIGGGGAGKSSVVNILLGENLAETNPQAGYTRHPTAFCSTPPADSFFPSTLRAVSAFVPGNIDEDIYDIRLRTRNILPNEVIVWDNSDVTTIHAAHYAHRVLEVLGLADAVIYVASAQRYNDRVPSEYVAILAKSGKPIVTCLTKVPPDQVNIVVSHFRHEVLRPLTQQINIPCVIIPYQPVQQLANPSATESYRRELLDTILPWFHNRQELRKRTYLEILTYLEAKEHQWLEIIRPELEAFEEWQRVIEAQRQMILSRYRDEFLAQERLAIFDEAMLRLIELLEIPGVGRWMSLALNVLRLPWRGAKALWHLLSGEPEHAGPLQSERETLSKALETALGQLWREVQSRRERSLFWQRLTMALDPGAQWQTKMLSMLEKYFSEYEIERKHLIETIACNIYSNLQARPTILNALRGIKLTIEVGSIASILVSAGINVYDAVLIPLATSMIQGLTEFLGSQYVETQREGARQTQLALVDKKVVQPIFSLVQNVDAIAEWRQLNLIFAELSNLRKQLSQAFSRPSRN
ncbi:MAG: GTPase domain-containing protein [Gemmatales bacterium]|nr:GTPase domain-containing protein [Gemmatales bacterium]MDW7994731.1 GTPase domain-containing protein [Gemmatales bacterium]